MDVFSEILKKSLWGYVLGVIMCIDWLVNRELKIDGV